MIITLDPWEYEWATLVGVRRFTANWNKQDAKHYDPSRMEDNRTAQVAAAVCELAVAKATNKYWAGTAWAGADHDKEKHRADVGTNIEVRRVRTRNAVAVRQKQVGKGLFIFATKAIEPEFRQVEILGWLDYDTAWALAEESDFHETRYLPLSELNKLVDKGNR
jgi:hypothetical protein